MAAAPGRISRPSPLTPRPYHFPRFGRRALPNGMQLVIAPVKKLPIATVIALQAMGLNAAILLAFAPDLAGVLAAALALLCMPSALLVWSWARARAGGSSASIRQRPP